MNALRLILWVAIVITAIVLQPRSKNNVCKTYEDYYSDRDSNPNCFYNPDHKLDVSSIIKRNGYNVTTYQVTTKDGYILTLLRVYSQYKASIKKPILIAHGLALNSGIFTLKGRKSLTFMLVEQGYDVWLGNFRGTRYSRRHIRFSDQDLNYWNFTMHELGIYDLRAKFRFIKKLTRQKVVYIGYSLGVFAGYIYGSAYPEEAKETIDCSIGLGGSVTLNNVPLLKMIRFAVETFAPAFQYFSKGVFYPRPFVPEYLFKYLCFPYPIQMKLCSLPEMTLSGLHYSETDPENYPTMLLHNIEGICIRQLLHLLQHTTSTQFHNYDYGEHGNVNIYGRRTPPNYNLSKVKYDSFIFCAKNDRIIPVENIQILYDMLPNSTYKRVYLIEDQDYNHMDYLIGKNADTFVYKPLINFLRSRKNH